MRRLKLAGDKATTAILIKDSNLKREQMDSAYADHIASECVGYSLEYDKKKPSAAFRKEYVARLMPHLFKQKIDYILCCDAEYFKTLTGAKKLDGNVGEALDCVFADHIKVMYCPSHASYFVNPDAEPLTQRVLKLFNKLTAGKFERVAVKLTYES